MILKKGLILVNVLVFGAIAIIVTSAMVNWGATMLKDTKQLSAREQAFQIAEAGIDYYRWHLAHSPTDYKDGTATTTNGPFIHDFEDKDGNVIGAFELTITPPLIGSTLVKIVSKGTVVEYPSVYRKIQSTLAIPSLAKYAVVANAFMNFGSGTVVQGPIHSNGGIHFDGIAYNIVSSAVNTFTDPDVNATKWAVYTTSGSDDPNPMTALPVRNDVFMAGRQFPLAAVDFNALTADLSNLKAQATSSGAYFAPSGAQGYHIVLNTNDTFTIYTVNSLINLTGSCATNATAQSQSGWGSWSINTQSAAIGTYAFPSNGIIFVEDNVWVDGTINTARLTIAAGVFPDDASTRKSITVNSNLLYTNYDGQDVIALIAQKNINAGFSSLNTQRIDAALVAQNGRAGRYYYSTNCGTGHTRSTLTLYGMIATNQRYGFAYSGGTGYTTRNIIYDSYLLYGPPPSFPLTSSQYTTLSWEEIK
ncbi:MAG: hypothetical protein AAB610_01570 [Patescibacteria group bacterium]